MKGCLLIHGYTGAPFEVEALAKHIHSLGYEVLCPTLHGHGGNRKELRKSTCADWFESVENSYFKLSESCDEIAVLGFSMGGLLAINLANKYSIKCLVTMSTPIYCFDTINLYLDIRDNIESRNFKRIIEYAYACFTPMKSNINFRKILWTTKPLLKKINVPLLVVHGKRDPVAHQRSAHYIYTQVSSNQKKIMLYDSLKHRFQYCNNPHAIYYDIGKFVQAHL
ncbi:MAG: alpha/beta fold hydrolase [Alkaliphilus sp.]|nr:alpha/beta fold hydrolase [Alkaliphilus sp.]